MAKVEITQKLKEEIFRKFKGESGKILDLMYSLKDNPRKGKFVGQVAGVVIKELKYKSFRFYFITNGYQLRILDAEHLKGLLVKFVMMSDKKSQQKVIDEIKNILKAFRDKSFN